MKCDADRLGEIMSAVGEKTAARFREVPPGSITGITEIRFHVGWPVKLFFGDECRFLGGGRMEAGPERCPAVFKAEINDIFKALCGYSVHSHQEEICRGFVTLKGGHRAGLCGTAVDSGERVTGIRDISSINIRVAREIWGAADGIIRSAFRVGLKSVLIIGPPCSGKTTVLRDMARQLSYGKGGKVTRVCVVDERGEIAAVWQGTPQMDMGPCCDVLDGWKKGAGVEAAVRSLSPQMVICDEIGSPEEAAALLGAMNCGVRAAASVHAASLEEALRRPGIKELMDAGVFDCAAVLTKAAGKPEVVHFKDGGKNAEDHRGDNAVYSLRGGGSGGGGSPFPAGENPAPLRGAGGFRGGGAELQPGAVG